MKVEIEAHLLVKALKTLSKIKEANPIHIEVTGDIVTLAKANSSDEIKSKIEGYSYENGKTLIPNATAELIAKIKNGLIVLTENEIKAGNKTISFEQSFLQDHCTELPLIEEVFRTTEKDLHRLLEVKYAIAKDETRPILCGVCFNKNEVCALDGYRLSLRIGSYDSEASFVVNKNTIEILDNLIDIKSNREVIVRYDTELQKVQFDIDNLEIIGDTIPGEFIKYKSIIPEESRLISKINSDSIKAELNFIGNVKTQYLKMNFTEDKLFLLTNQCKEEFDEAASHNRTKELQDQEHKDFQKKYNDWVKKKTAAEKKKKAFRIKEPREKIIRLQKVYSLVPVTKIKSEVDCNTKLEADVAELIIACNLKYLSEALKSYKNFVNLKMYNAVSPIVITEDNENLELVLPIRFKE